MLVKRDIFVYVWKKIPGLTYAKIEILNKSVKFKPQNIFTKASAPKPLTLKFLKFFFFANPDLWDLEKGRKFQINIHEQTCKSGDKKVECQVFATAPKSASDKPINIILYHRQFGSTQITHSACGIGSKWSKTFPLLTAIAIEKP